MTRPADAWRRVAEAIAKVGEPALLVRLPGVSGTRAELPIKAVPTFQLPAEPAGGVVQAHREIRIGDNEIKASNWPAPIKRGDQIIMGGVTYSIQGVQTAKPAGVGAIHYLSVMRAG